ncbi:MAG: transglycosylase SLT domain-containing protein [Sphingomonas bacterium]|nr:transglycosylase SLT domain-containing protein [Sphingomonas bacterium]
MSFFLPLLLATPASAAEQPYPQPGYPQPAYPTPYAQPTTVYRPAMVQAYNDVDAALSDWKRLRQSDGYAFTNYARFLGANPGWPGEASLRKAAEKAMRPGENPLSVSGFFRNAEPISGNGWARLAESYAATGKPAEALAAARNAWKSGDLPSADEPALLARFGAQFTPADHDKRIDGLLFAKKASDSQRLLGWASAARRPALSARIAMLMRSPDAELQFAAVAGQARTDAGLMMDRVRFLRDTGNEPAARQLAARSHSFVEQPADPERFYEMLVILARGAAADRQWQSSYDISRQVDDAFAPGTEMALKSYGVRDEYTTLTWIAGTSALQLGRAADAVTMFDKYARGGRSLQVATKGWYWAGRSAAQAGRMADAMAHFERAAATPELFYGQLALERLGRPVPTPGVLPALQVTDGQRQAFQYRRLVRAVRQLGSQGRRDEQSLFIRALSEDVDTPAERVLATEFASTIGRQDLAVWTARSARNSGAAFYTRASFPTHSSSVPGGRMWSLVHGITRQESSFDRAAVSHAGARGMMQLMPGTAREQAGKMGLSYDGGRLMSDPAYNVMLGSAYFQRLVDQWGGNYPLAVASYNAGAGNVRKWVNAYGDPRLPGGDIVSWIERIPFDETRGYVQRVLENSVVYDCLNPTNAAPQPVHISAYLGKSSRPG